MARMPVILAAALLAAGSAAAASVPKLALVHRQPLVVRGTGFAAHERVVVSGPALRVVVHSTAGGSFVGMLSEGDRCAGGRIVAVGARGDRAVLRLPPIECAPAGTP